MRSVAAALILASTVVAKISVYESLDWIGQPHVFEPKAAHRTTAFPTGEADTWIWVPTTGNIPCFPCPPCPLASLSSLSSLASPSLVLENLRDKHVTHTQQAANASMARKPACTSVTPRVAVQTSACTTRAAVHVSTRLLALKLPPIRIRARQRRLASFRVPTLATP
jgi:hypothetical protein